MRDFLIAINGSDLIESTNIGRKTSVDAEDLFVYEGSQAKAVEALDAMAPDTGVAVFAKAFVVKAVDLGDLAGL